ncbi:MAG: hypothetical protein ABIA93_03510 [Candidatus Woesearchaeota archaeon]
MQAIGSWAFLIGVILAVILGALGAVTSTIALILVIIGLIIGLLNITDKETNAFLMAAVSLVIVTGLSGNTLATVSGLDWLWRIFSAIMLLFVPATIIVALKSVFTLAKSK